MDLESSVAAAAEQLVQQLPQQPGKTSSRPALQHLGGVDPPPDGRGALLRQGEEWGRQQAAIATRLFGGGWW